MARLVNADTWYYDTFPVFEKDLYTKKPGLAQSDFSISVKYNNTIDGLPISIAEYAATGDYWARFKFDKPGFWEIEIKIPYNNQIWHETFDVKSLSDMFSMFDIRGSVCWNTSRNELVCYAWLLKNGELVETPGNCYWDFYDMNHALLFSLTQLTPAPNGVFKISKQGPVFGLDENYYYIVKIHDGQGLRKSPLSFITVV